ncbi:hypothetical protein EIN_404970 [Entamoeba invadens IP1]|uniref:Uncharacterized protein n=1 Tax=Entamoeba invadens IP1 TaxID=370355 RepID=A0A0A1U6P0_ENTIV|nr:hypothetical protein EIN_404970 [Entamoeba invadens IP1]ELP90083.1 hypothetical protein EIN_404970 [Entamoeba invadens IP1]|eukprot:XP_004256854.1 hypothetical protein EIN_404970 [Entamoeba invadens IP1]
MILVLIELVCFSLAQYHSVSVIEYTQVEWLYSLDVCYQVTAELFRRNTYHNSNTFNMTTYSDDTCTTEVNRVYVTSGEVATVRFNLYAIPLEDISYEYFKLETPVTPATVVRILVPSNKCQLCGVVDCRTTVGYIPSNDMLHIGTEFFKSSNGTCEGDALTFRPETPCGFTNKTRYDTSTFSYITYSQIIKCNFTCGNGGELSDNQTKCICREDDHFVVDAVEGEGHGKCLCDSKYTESTIGTCVFACKGKGSVLESGDKCICDHSRNYYGEDPFFCLYYCIGSGNITNSDNDGCQCNVKEGFALINDTCVFQCPIQGSVTNNENDGCECDNKSGYFFINMTCVFVCSNRGEITNESNDGCICDNSSNYYLVNNTCTYLCSTKGEITNKNNNGCICDAHSNYENVNGKCVLQCSSEGTVLNENNNSCVCDEFNGYFLHNETCLYRDFTSLLSIWITFLYIVIVCIFRVKCSNIFNRIDIIY